MLRNKNEAQLTYKGESFTLWQDQNLNWCFTYSNLENVNTQHKELQPALNEIFSSIEEKMTGPRPSVPPLKLQKPKAKKPRTLKKKVVSN